MPVNLSGGDSQTMFRIRSDVSTLKNIVKSFELWHRQAPDGSMGAFATAFLDHRYSLPGFNRELSQAQLAAAQFALPFFAREINADSSISLLAVLGAVAEAERFVVDPGLAIRKAIGWRMSPYLDSRTVGGAGVADLNAAFKRAESNFREALARAEREQMGLGSGQQPQEEVRPSSKVKPGRYFALFPYRDHYGWLLRDVPNPESCIAELFLFRGWTTQAGFRLFSSDQSESDRIVQTVVDTARLIGFPGLASTQGVDVRTLWSEDLMTVLEKRWWEYDDFIVKHEATDKELVPTRKICRAVIGHCGIRDIQKYVLLCANFVEQLGEIQQEALSTGLLR